MYEGNLQKANLKQRQDVSSSAFRHVAFARGLREVRTSRRTSAIETTNIRVFSVCERNIYLLNARGTG